MKSLIPSFLFLIGAISGQDCPSLRVRYEYRELPIATRAQFLAAVKAQFQAGALTKFVDQHIEVASTAHGVPEFLPWHRHFMFAFEQQVGMDLPYWDWAADAQAPEACIINSSGNFGTDGAGSCVKDSFLGVVNYQGECVTTQWDGGKGKIGSYYSIDAVAKLITDNPKYDAFRTAYEGTAHARVHNGFGASFAKMWSPANVIFFLHHSCVDRHYAIWQKQNKFDDFPKPLTTMLPVYNRTIQSILRIDSAPYCYTYSNMDIINTGRSKAGLNRRSLSAPVKMNLFRRNLDKLQAPVDKCGQIDEKTGYRYPPCSEDRENLIDLRMVKPIPDWYLHANNINVTAIRAVECEHRAFVHQLNNLPGYVSPSALYNRPKLLTNLYEHGQTKVCVYNDDNEKQSVPCPIENKIPSEELPDFIRKSTEKHYSVSKYNDLAKDLDDTFGPELASTLISCGQHLANKPYQPHAEVAMDNGGSRGGDHYGGGDVNAAASKFNPSAGQYDDNSMDFGFENSGDDASYGEEEDDASQY